MWGKNILLSVPAGTTGQWHLNGNPIPGATGTSYAVTSSGTYSFVGTDVNGCAFTGCTNAAFIAGPCGSIGNYVWNDTNNNGLNDEPTSAGINGVIVELWIETSPGSGTYSLVRTDTTSNNGANPGYYLFNVSQSANYYVKFPTTNNGNVLTTQTTTAATDNNSDANTTTGFSPIFCH